MARACPSPYGKGGVLSAARGRLRSGDRKLQTEKTAGLGPVARGPSEVSIRASERVSPEIAAWRGTGPRPTVSDAILDTVARGPVPRERWSAPTLARETLSDARLASEGPRPTVTYHFFTVSRGMSPRR